MSSKAYRKNLGKKETSPIDKIIASCIKKRKVKKCEDCLHCEIKDCAYLYEKKCSNNEDMTGWRNDWKATWDVEAWLEKRRLERLEQEAKEQ